MIPTKKKKDNHKYNKDNHKDNKDAHKDKKDIDKDKGDTHKDNQYPQYLGRDHLMCGGTDHSIFRSY